MLAGLIGVPLGSFMAQKYRTTIAECDPIICGFGTLVSAPFVYLVLITAGHNSGVSFFFVFVAMMALNTCWSLVADMLLVRRNTDSEDGPEEEEEEETTADDNYWTKIRFLILSDRLT